MRAGALLILVALLAGCASEPPGDGGAADASAPTVPLPASVLPADVAPAGLGATVRHAVRNATAGHDVTYLVEVSGLAGRGATVQLEGARAAGSATLAPGDPPGVFVTLAVDAAATEGDDPLTLRVTADDGPAWVLEDAATLRVLAPAGPTYEAGDAAQVRYTLRDLGGAAVATNDEALAGIVFRQDPTFRAVPPPLLVREGNVIPGVHAALLGAQVGESRTASFPPSEGYGEWKVLETVPRTETLALEARVPHAPVSTPRSFFDMLIEKTGQGDPATMEGKTFELTHEGVTWRYRVLELTELAARYREEPLPGDVRTLYPAWPNASVVLDVDEDGILYRTTPATGPSTNVTWRWGWPEVSSILEVTAEHVVVRHDPPVGQLDATISGRRVAEVTEESIVVVATGGHALEGRSLTVDLELLEILPPP